MKLLIFILSFILNPCNKADGQLSQTPITDGDIYDNNVADKLGNFYYSSDDFIKKRRLIPDNIYKMIHSSFLEMTNKERLKILNKLSK